MGRPVLAEAFPGLLQRVEARLAVAEHGPVETLFRPSTRRGPLRPPWATLVGATVRRGRHPDPAGRRLVHRPVPQVLLPMGFVPAIDEDLLAWWGKDRLWQAQDDRYTADQVRIIPGPVSVSGITTVNEPVADRSAASRPPAATVSPAPAPPATARRPAVTPSRSGRTATPRPPPRRPWRVWPMRPTSPPTCRPCSTSPGPAPDGQPGPRHRRRQLRAGRHQRRFRRQPCHRHRRPALDTLWDNTAAGSGDSQVHAVRRLPLPDLDDSISTGALPVVDESCLPDTMYGLLAGTAGVGNVRSPATTSPACPPRSRA